ncbi:uncharacterized protein LOC144904428 isoform X5 [Branchiostoma floridae x Branchiostoma belcheri]
MINEKLHISIAHIRRSIVKDYYRLRPRNRQRDHDVILRWRDVASVVGVRSHGGYKRRESLRFAAHRGSATAHSHRRPSTSQPARPSTSQPTISRQATDTAHPSVSRHSRPNSKKTTTVTYRTSGDRMDPRVSLPVGMLVLILMGTRVTGQEQPVYLTEIDTWDFYKVRASGPMTGTNVKLTCTAAGMDYPCYNADPECSHSPYYRSDCVAFDYGGNRCGTEQILSIKLCGNPDAGHCQPLDDTFMYTPGWRSDDSAWGADYDTRSGNLYGVNYNDMYALCAVSTTCAASPCAHGTCTGGDQGYTCTCESGWSGRNCDQEEPVYLATEDNWAFYKVRARGQMLNPTVRETCQAAGMDHPCRYSGAAGCTSSWWTSGCITYVGSGRSPCHTHAVLSTKLCGHNEPWRCQPLDDTFVYMPDWQSDDSAYGVDYETNATHLQGANYNNKYALCAVSTTCAASPCAHGTCTGGDQGYTCTCESGWTGRNCDQASEDVDECEAGTHNCSAHANCTNFPGGFNCTCNAGYSGDGVTCTGTTADLSDLTFSDIEMDRMTLSWTVSADVTRYRLRYRHAGASYQDLSPPPAPSDTQATVRGLWADTEYNFTLTAFGEDDEDIGEISGTETTAEVIVNVDCHQDHMSVTFPRAALTEVDVDTLHLSDDTCRATYTETEVTLRTGLQECGTIQESSEDKLIFSNEAIGSPVVHDNGAVRGATFSKSFQCEFVSQFVISQEQNILYNIPSPRVQVVTAENQFTFEMHMFPSANFADTYTSDDFPVQVTPSDQLHFGLSVNSPLDNLELFALHCLATPSDDPEASPSVNIIQDGCDIDTTLQLNNALSNDMALYYSIQSFTFPNVEDPSLVYIHCTMVVCFKDDPDSRCSEGCIPATRRRRAVSDMSEARVRRASETDETVTISQGPFQVVRGEKQASAVAVPTVGIAVGTAAGIAGVLLMVAAVFLVRKRRGRDVKEQAEDRVGFDNYSFELWERTRLPTRPPNLSSRFLCEARNFSMSHVLM